MMFFSGSEPDAVVDGAGGFVAQNQDDLFFHINSKAAEHWIGARTEFGESIKHELMRNGFARFDAQRILSWPRLIAARL